MLSMPKITATTNRKLSRQIDENCRNESFADYKASLKVVETTIGVSVQIKIGVKRK